MVSLWSTHAKDHLIKPPKEGFLGALSTGSAWRAGQGWDSHNLEILNGIGVNPLTQFRAPNQNPKLLEVHK